MTKDNTEDFPPEIRLQYRDGGWVWETYNSGEVSKSERASPSAQAAAAEAQLHMELGRMAKGFRKNNPTQVPTERPAYE